MRGRVGPAPSAKAYGPQAPGTEFLRGYRIAGLPQVLQRTVALNAFCHHRSLLRVGPLKCFAPAGSARVPVRPAFSRSSLRLPRLPMTLLIIARLRN